MSQPEDLRPGTPDPAPREIRPDPETTSAPEQPAPFVPAPVSRRIWAWMGIVYMVIIIFLITYWMATTTFLSGITGIMLFPLLGALSAQGFNNAALCRRGERSGSPALLTATAVIMALLTLSVLAFGVVQLLDNWGV